MIDEPSAIEQLCNVWGAQRRTLLGISENAGEAVATAVALCRTVSFRPRSRVEHYTDGAQLIEAAWVGMRTDLKAVFEVEHLFPAVDLEVKCRALDVRPQTFHSRLGDARACAETYVREALVATSPEVTRESQNRYKNRRLSIVRKGLFW